MKTAILVLVAYLCHVSCSILRTSFLASNFGVSSYTKVDRLIVTRGGSKKDKNSSKRKDKTTSKNRKGGKDKDNLRRSSKSIAGDNKLNTKKSQVEDKIEVAEEEFSMPNDDQIEDDVEKKSVFSNSMVSEIIARTPPITLGYLLSSGIITVVAFLFNKNKWPDVLFFEWKPILTGFQFWRIFTGFLFFGPLDIFYPLTMQFVWQHMSQLEKMNYNQPEVFFIILIFGAFTLIPLYSLIGISHRFLGHNLATYLVYIWSRVFEGMDVNFMDLFVLKSELLPWFFCVQTYLLDHEFPLADLLGIAVGHLYYYLSKKNLLDAPQALKNAFQTPYWKEKYIRFRDDFE